MNRSYKKRKELKLYLEEEKGAVLVLALLILVAITVLGIAILINSTTEVKISGNNLTSSEAFYAAESGIQHALATIKVITEDWTISSDNFTPRLAGATALNPWVNFLSSGNYVITIKDDNDETGTLDPAKDTNRRIYVRSESNTSSGAKKVIEVLVQGYKQDDLSVWYNAIFSGSGQSGKHIDQKVIIGGSVHLLGENSSGVQTVPKSGVVMIMGDDALVSNNYNGMAALLKSVIPDITTAQQSLDAVVRVKYGKVSLTDKSRLGAPEKTTPYKDFLDGVYITDGYSKKDDLKQVYTDESGVYNDSVPIDLQSQIKTPSLNNEISSGVTYINWLSTNSVHIPTLDIDFDDDAAKYLQDHKSEIESQYPGTTVTADKSSKNFTVTRTDPNGNNHSISWVNNSRTLTVKGIVTVDGDLDLGSGQDKKDITYITDNTSINGTTTVGSTIFANSYGTKTGKIKIHNSMLPAGSKSFAIPSGETLGFVAKNIIEIAVTGADSNLTVAGAFFAENTIISGKKNDVAGAFVSNYINLGTDTPSIYMVPKLVTNLPPGLPGSQRVLIKRPPKFLSWREIQ